jgi:L-asparaginase II
VTRGSLVENGTLLLALGDVARPIFPRSAVKAMQAIPLIESGAADAFGLGEEELAVACASHSGEAVHLAAVRKLLAKSGLDESLLACGAHWPIGENASRELTRADRNPTPIHNNCSGKHAGMLAVARHLGIATRGYERPDHPVQEEIRRILSETCRVRLERDAMGIDGCSIPTFAFPLQGLATGFARLATGKGLSASRAGAARRLMKACFAHPVLVAGEGRFDTTVMRGLPRVVFAKGGAEGVHCASLPERGIGIAVKVDDGAKRGAETTLAHVIATLVPGADRVLSNHLRGELRNWHGAKVGQLRPSPALEQGLAALAKTASPAALAPR